MRPGQLLSHGGVAPDKAPHNPFSRLAFPPPPSITQLHGIRAGRARGCEDTGPPGELSALANVCTPGYAVVEYLVV